MSELKSVEQFLFSVPLYSQLELPADMRTKGVLVGYEGAKADGYCIGYGKPTTFTVFRKVKPNFQNESARIRFVSEKTGYFDLTAYCARNQTHELQYWYRLTENSVLKVGQFPSLADIANDESSQYRSVLGKIDSAELHKAVGLAAHGVGIGAFVYLRRIFERLVNSRFAEFKVPEEWKDDDFHKLRMNEKVAFLKSHLPGFLVENADLYSVLSLGIHELTDEKCLSAFEPIKLSIKIILEEDKKKREELELKKMAAAAIKNFSK